MASCAIAVVSAVDDVPAAVLLALLLLLFIMLLLAAAVAGVLLLTLQRPCLAYRTAALFRTDNFSTIGDIQY